MNDSVTLGLASTAVGLVKNTIDLLKQARDAAKQTDDHDLKGKLNKVLDAVLELKLVVVDLRKENESLQKQLETRTSLAWNSDSKLYFAENDLDPFCPACMDRDGKQARLHSRLNTGIQLGWECKVCNSTFSMHEKRARG